MFRTTLTTLLLVLTTQLFAQKIKVKEYKSGNCTTETVYSDNMEASPSGKHGYVTGFKKIKGKIKGEVGTNFGSQYMLKCDKDQTVMVEQVWIFPDVMIDSNGKKFKELRYPNKITTNRKTFSTYKLEQEHEVLLGTWIYQIIYKNEIIYQKEFIVE